MTGVPSPEVGRFHRYIATTTKIYTRVSTSEIYHTHCINREKPCILKR